MLLLDNKTHQNLSNTLDLVRQWYEKAPIRDLETIEKALGQNFPYKEIIAALGELGQAPERERILMPDLAAPTRQIAARDCQPPTAEAVGLWDSP